MGVQDSRFHKSHPQVKFLEGEGGNNGFWPARVSTYKFPNNNGAIGCIPRAEFYVNHCVLKHHMGLVVHYFSPKPMRYIGFNVSIKCHRSMWLIGSSTRNKKHMRGRFPAISSEIVLTEVVLDAHRGVPVQPLGRGSCCQFFKSLFLHDWS